MQLTDIQIDRFGVLDHVSVEKLSHRVTVFWGPNGSGKSTLVRFLRGLFFGYQRNIPWTQADLHTESGFARIQTAAGQRTLRRQWSMSNIEQFTLTDQVDREVVSGSGNSLPAWVTEDIFREVFTVRYEEAERFELLSRLCMESGGGRNDTDSELRQAEAALIQTIRDRDGNGVQGGVVHRISELRGRQSHLQTEIANLRRPAADLPAAIEQLHREIDAATQNIEQIDTRIRDIDSEITRLDQLLIELRRCNVLPLNHQAIEGEIRTVLARLDRWQKIRGLIERETEARRSSVELQSSPEASLRTIRAIISRLEERVQALTDRQRGASITESERIKDADVIRLLRGEIASLCLYFGEHERATAWHLGSLESMLAEKTESDAIQMEGLLEEQLTTLRAELARSENVLGVNVLPKSDIVCRFTGHRDSIVAETASRGGFRTTAEVEAQLDRLRVERSRLVGERSSIDQSRNSKRIQLDRLRQELAGAATLEQVDALRAQIAQLEAEIGMLEDQRRLLDRTETSLRETIERIKARSHSRVLELASEYVQRLTENECRRITIAAADRVLVQTTHTNEQLSLQQLSRGTRDQVGLALRLALIQVRSETYGHVPLILDDVFVTSDDARANAAVKLLTELAQQGHQILFFTCQKDVRDLFARFNPDLRSFDYRAQIPKPIVVAPPVPPQPILHAYVEPVVELRPIVMTPPAVPQPVAEPEPHPMSATNWLFYLEVDHGVEELSGITLGELEALRTSGILTIDDVLNRTVPQIQEVARLKGFQLSVDRLHALRGQAELTTRVPMLRRSDAALLYAAGIHSTEELSRLRPETVYDRVSEFQRSEAGSRYRRGGRLIDRQQAINWARFGQFTRTLDDARHNRSRFSTRSGMSSISSGSHASSARAVTRTSTNSRRDHADSESHGISRRHRRISSDADAEQRRARRFARRRQQMGRLRTSTIEKDAEVDEVDKVAEQSGGLRFYLNRTSPIEKAPSIGPRTAEMLEAIGIRTVEELMNITPERIAEKLDHRRITPKVILQWQQQSRMMCQIPELRGHDAQILVACGITTPEGLASQSAASLLSVVEPFSSSKEGERIIRNGRKPDLAEVTEWVQWAANARSFKAA